MQHRDVRNPRGPADGITVSAPIPGEVQCSAPAGSVFIQDTRTCEPAAPLRLLLFVAVMNFFSTVFTLCLHVVVVSLNLSGALDDWCVAGHSSPCWSLAPRTAMVSRLAPWWLSIQEIGKIPAGYLTLDQYEACQ